MDVYIYSLSDPRTNEIRYVGKSINPDFRFQCHLFDKGRNRKCMWLRSLSSCGRKPEMDVLEKIIDSNDEDWQESERFWISYLRFLGCRLTNSDSGGRAGKLMNDESRQKMSIAASARTGLRNTFWGKKHSSESKSKIGNANRGRMRSPEAVEKSRIAAIGRIPWNKGMAMPAWICEKVSDGLNKNPRIGWKHTEASKAKMRLKLKGRVAWNKGIPSSRPSPMLGKKHTPEARAKISLSKKGRVSPMKGRAHSMTSRANMSAAAKGRVPWNKGLKLK